MAIEFSVSLQNRPGAIAELTEALARQGVMLMAVHAAAFADTGVIQFVASNPDATVAALRDASVEYTTSQVLLVSVANQPGLLARLARALAEQNININSVYLTLSGQIVLNVDDVNAAQKVILGLDLNQGHVIG